jgi:hypothetical protein
MISVDPAFSAECADGANIKKQIAVVDKNFEKRFINSVLV